MPRTIHVWIGSQAAADLRLGDDESIGAAVVEHFLQVRARQRRAEAAVAAGADAEAAVIEAASAAPTHADSNDGRAAYRIRVEREGAESDEFIEGFRDG